MVNGNMYIPINIHIDLITAFDKPYLEICYLQLASEILDPLNVAILSVVVTKCMEPLQLSLCLNIYYFD